MNNVFIRINFCLLLLWIVLGSYSYINPYIAVFTSGIQLLVAIYLLIISGIVLITATSKHKLAVILFCLPFVSIVIVPHIKHEFMLVTTIPDDQLIKRYIQKQHIGTTEILDTSIEIASYNVKESNLNLTLRIMPDVFIKNQSQLYDDRQIGPVGSAKMMMHDMFRNFIYLPNHVFEVTTVPRTITVYGYWGNDLIMRAVFRKNDKQWYQLVHPYPSISLVGDVNKLQLQYDFNNSKRSIDLSMEHLPTSYFRFDLVEDKSTE
ncbi:hypothetical protein H8B09_13395 [Paenibacillus sp. PR3]|uniref:Uncharacterized protein n=1 Tax=Paenibacillus terricola TaxID=2763503 RepID=A0ABR8MUW3_9BACL|nr:hypothetical protein [Paenibacillus terricola]MBD3919752.1 hypothetical protein [Paenibacillus terricola]